MDTDIATAIIGAIGAIVAAVLGALAGRTDWVDRLVARNPFPILEGTRLESKWANVVDGKPHEYREVIEIKKQKRGRLYGIVTMDEDQGKRWAVEGDYNGRFLRLFWHATHDKFYLDHGCYFFERQGDGTFRGYSVGFDARLNKVAVDDHVVRPLPQLNVRKPARQSLTGNGWLSTKVELRRSPLEGVGLFARRKIRSGERVVIFGGEIMAIKELGRLPPHLQHYPFQIEERFVLGRRDMKAPLPTECFNHSCDPNCGFKGQIFMVAMREIQRGEELTVDYAMLVSKSHGSRVRFQMACHCGSKRCRKIISEEDWMDLGLQRRYRGYFSQYIEEKIERRRRAC